MPKRCAWLWSMTRGYMKTDSETTMLLHCTRCSLPVSTPVPVSTVIRATIECPKCAAESDPATTEQLQNELQYYLEVIEANLLVTDDLRIKYAKRPLIQPLNDTTDTERLDWWLSRPFDWFETRAEIDAAMRRKEA